MEHFTRKSTVFDDSFLEKNILLCCNSMRKNHVKDNIRPHSAHRTCVKMKLNKKFLSYELAKFFRSSDDCKCTTQTLRCKGSSTAPVRLHLFCMKWTFSFFTSEQIQNYLQVADTAFGLCAVVIMVLCVRKYLDAMQEQIFLNTLNFNLCIVALYDRSR